MAIRKGKCRNYSQCSLAEKNIIQEIAESDDFVCRECGEPLHELPVRKKTNILPFVWGGLVLLIIGLAAWLFVILSNKTESHRPTVADTEPDELDTIELSQPIVTIVRDTVVVRDTLLIGVETGNLITEEHPSSQPEAKEKPVVKERAKPASRPAAPASHSLGYGKWSGSWRNGQPHGSGTLTYSRSQRIDSRDMKGRVAQPGEYIIGEWDNGHLVQGRWFKNDGTKEAIIIGKAN